MAKPFQVERGIAMNSGAPGGFECETFIAAWAEGAHTNTAIRHINECPYCRAVIHGEGDFLKPTEEQDANLAQHFAETQKMTERGFAPLSKTPWAPPADPKAEAYFEELKVRFAKELLEDDESPRVTPAVAMQKTAPAPIDAETGSVPLSRRSGLKFLAAAGVVAITGLSSYMLGAGLNLEAKAPNSNRIAARVSKFQEMTFGKLDKLMTARGRAGVLPLFNAGSNKNAVMVVLWIADRNHTALFDVLAAATFDNRIKVRDVARLAANGVALVDLKPHSASLTIAVQTETDLNWRNFLYDLLTRVNNS